MRRHRILRAALAAALLWLALLATFPLAALALAAAPLTVSLRDDEGRGIAGATIAVLRDDGQRIASASTDARGLATLGPLPALGRALVAVSGRLADGTALTTGPFDRPGILCFGLAGELRLVAEPDGVVIPDPSDFGDREPLFTDKTAAQTTVTQTAIDAIDAADTADATTAAPQRAARVIGSASVPPAAQRDGAMALRLLAAGFGVALLAYSGALGWTRRAGSHRRRGRVWRQR